MKSKAIISSKRIDLRLLRPSDVHLGYVNGLNDSAVNRFLVGVRSRRQTLEGVRSYVRRNMDSPNDYLFGIFLKRTNTYVGTIRLSEINLFHFCATIGICIFDRKNGWGHGYGREATESLVNFAFKKLGLHYLEGGAYLANKASVKMFLAAGFKKEVLFCNKYRYGKAFVPVVILGKTNKRFQFPT
jgi:RimJ/RimL family protein N-acetyltransferase